MIIILEIKGHFRKNQSLYSTLLHNNIVVDLNALPISIDLDLEDIYSRIPRKLIWPLLQTSLKYFSTHSLKLQSKHNKKWRLPDFHPIVSTKCRVEMKITSHILPSFCKFFYRKKSHQEKPQKLQKLFFAKHHSLKVFPLILFLLSFAWIHCLYKLLMLMMIVQWVTIRCFNSNLPRRLFFFLLVAYT